MELTQKPRTGDFILSLATKTRSLENAILNSGQNCDAGEVLGQILTGTGTKISGTGDGTISAVTIGKNAEIGTYVLTGKTEASNAGTFSVRTPSGNYLPDLTVAVAYSTTHIGLTVADGSADWDIADVIHVVVAAGDYEALDPAEDDGVQIAAGVLYAGADATDGDVAIVVVARDAELKSDAITWPDGITEAQQAAATAQLAARGIFLR